MSGKPVMWIIPVDPYSGDRRITDTAGPSGSVSVQTVGDQDPDGRITSASICLCDQYLLTPEEAIAIATDLLVTAREYRDAGLKP